MNVIQEEGSRPIKAWIDRKADGTLNIEDSALEQLKNLARLPFIASNGVAVMPDVHAGIGSTVGSVIATDKAIIPAAVGVDIGCFRGDTRIPLLDGSQATLQELTLRTEPFWVYSINAEGKIAPGRAIALKTRSDAELMRIVVSGGDEIFCTPDHEFMLNDGTYREARALKFNDSLMPLYRKWQTRDGYESANNGKGLSAQTHTLVWEALNGPVPECHVVHHDNHIHFDNRPENLVLMTAADHSAHHRLVGRKFNNSDPGFQEKRQVGIDARSADPKKMAAMVEVGTKNITAYMAENPEHFKEAVAANGKRGAPYLANFNTSPRTCSDCGAESANPAALRWHKQREHQSNHKVIAAMRLTDRADVFCLQVEEHHNFALAAGVFVHNCGMNAVRLTLRADQLPDSLANIRAAIEKAVPVGNAMHNTSDDRFPSGFCDDVYRSAWMDALSSERKASADKLMDRASRQLGSLGSGNHFIELCIDESDQVWVMLHSGSRGIGNMIGSHFIERAKRNMEKFFINLPDQNLAYLPEDTEDFNEYVEAVQWAQNYALENRRQMMVAVLEALRQSMPVAFLPTTEAVNCHHNYVEKENHFGKNIWVTRKGAVRAREGDLGIIPGSMGQRSYIVRGKGNPQAYCSCSHGAGRVMSRSEARRRFSLTDLIAQTEGVECRKDDAVLDEIPGSYKSIDTVMNNQKDLVEVVHVLRAVLCVKGG